MTIIASICSDGRRWCDLAKKSGVIIKFDKFPALANAAPRLLDDAVAAVAFDGERYVKQSFGTSPPGRSYNYGNVVHVASQSGYPPNVDTGKLRAGIFTRRDGQARYTISTGDTEYAVLLEYGTRNTAARPFMTPMAFYLQGSFGDIIRNALKAGLK